MDHQEKFAMSVVEQVKIKSALEKLNKPETDISELLALLKLCEQEIIHKPIFNYSTESLTMKKFLSPLNEASLRAWENV